MTETSTTSKPKTAMETNGADGPTGPAWADPSSLIRANQAALETGLACWQEMMALSQTQTRTGIETLGRLSDCRTPGDALRVQAEQTRSFADACVDGADRLRAIVRDRLMPPTVTPSDIE